VRKLMANLHGDPRHYDIVSLDQSEEKRVNQRAIGTHDQRANGTRTSGCTGRSRAVLDAPAFVAGFDDVAVMGEAIE
jgi:hypothetical protein